MAAVTMFVISGHLKLIGTNLMMTRQENLPAVNKILFCSLSCRSVAYLHGCDLSAVQVCKCSVASALDSAAYLLFYVKQGSSPWFSTLLEKEDKCPLAGSVSLEEQGETAPFNKEGQARYNNESCLVESPGPHLWRKDLPQFIHSSDPTHASSTGSANKEEEAASSHGQGEIARINKEEATTSLEQRNGSTLLDLSEQLQRNGNVNTLSDASDKLEEGCRMGETSTGTQGPSCLIGSGDKNGHADGCWEPSGKMKDVSPGGSLNKKEAKPMTCGSVEVEVDHAVTQGGSPRNENNCHSLQLSHKHKDNCDFLEVDHAVTQGDSPQINENNCHVLQLPHDRRDNFCRRSLSLQGKDDLIPMLTGIN
jgi:hypothetical protein